VLRRLAVVKKNYQHYLPAVFLRQFPSHSCKSTNKVFDFYKIAYIGNADIVYEILTIGINDIGITFIDIYFITSLTVT